HAGRRSPLRVERKAVGAGYPLYGRFETHPASPLGELLAGDGALADQTALARLGVGIGDTVLVGDAKLIIRGVIENEPDRAGRIISLGPRLLVAGPTLDRAGLIQLGSRVNHRVLVRLADTLRATDRRAQRARVISNPSTCLR